MGADLYVARLGHTKGGSSPAELTSSLLSSTSPSTSALGSCAVPAAKPKSLHDELRHPKPKLKPEHQGSNHVEKYCPLVAESRPCYRCIAFMHTMGIRRVFWTNAQGGWEGGKVVDLVDALDGVDGDSDEQKLYVTKHEVLMLRRVLGMG